MKHLLSIFLLVFFFSSILLLNKVYKPPHALSAPTSVTADTLVTAILGIPINRLYGYTSPFAKVEMEGIGVLNTTYADADGYFQFIRFYIAHFTFEICLTAYDRSNRLTNPVCVSLPDKNKPITEIGPVIISPSLTIGKGLFLTDETVAAEGESIPNSEIVVSLFRENRNTITKIFDNITKPLSIPKIILNPVASAPPVYTTKTDQNGAYSFNLPSAFVNNYRVFTQTKYNDSPSPRSNTLAYKVLNIFEFIIQKIKLFFLAILYFLQKLPLFEAFIVFELILFIYLIKKYVHIVKSQKHRELMIEKNQIVEYEKGRELVN